MSLVLTNSYLVTPTQMQESVSPALLASRAAFMVTPYGAGYYSIPGASDDGQYRIYTPRGVVYVSRDYGQTWSTYALGDTTGVACNSTGSVMYAVSYGGGGASTGATYVSTDYGYNWSIPGANHFDSYSVATNQTGQYAVLGMWNGSAARVTSDTGNNWSFTSNAPGGWPIRTVAMDSSGSVIVTSAGYRSLNSGASWTRIDANDINSSVAISGDATKILMGDLATNYLKLSINGGNSFTNISSLPYTSWGFVAMSRGGTVMAARTTSGSRFISYNSGSTWAGF